MYIVEYVHLRVVSVTLINGAKCLVSQSLELSMCRADRLHPHHTGTVAWCHATFPPVKTWFPRGALQP